jgi:hypothetical protein
MEHNPLWEAQSKLVTKLSYFMEPEGSVANLQEPATFPYPK